MTFTSDRRLEIRRDPLLTEKLVYHVGPQHPSLPAAIHFTVQCDGELIEQVTPEVGYLHRGVEQLATTRPWHECAALLSRCEWLAGMNGDYLLAAAVEELAGVDVPERAQWLRMLMLELSRLASHIWWWGEIGHEAGAITPIFWALREREVILSLLELLSGHRWHHQWIVPGGVAGEPPAEFWQRLDSVLSQLDAALVQFEEFFSDNAIWVNRSEMIGTLEPGFAQAHGASGPVLRGSGIRHDLRADSPYLFYGELSIEVPVGEFGDVLDRYRIRMAEIRESLRLVRRIRDLLPVGGAVMAPEVPPAGKLEVPKGSCYTAVEGPRGELGLWTVSDGGPHPVRLHLRSPSLYHVFLLDELCRGYLLADFFVIYGSLDVMVGEVDR